jgi:hypothetical protein
MPARPHTPEPPFRASAPTAATSQRQQLTAGTHHGTVGLLTEAAGGWPGLASFITAATGGATGLKALRRLLT